eukprot:CFRG2494T1
MVEFSSSEVDIPLPHIRLAGRRWGDKSKPLLLALHGWLDNANSFEPLAQKLTQEHGFQVLAIDWPGHGLSEHRKGRYMLHFVDYICDVDVLVSYLTRSPSYGAPIAIVGHSLGGIIASSFTAAFPNRVKHLVLIEAVAPLYEDPSNAHARLKKGLESHLQFVKKLQVKDIALAEGEITHQPSVVYESSEVAVQARAKLTGMDEQWCRMLIQRNMNVHENGVSWRSDPRLRLDSLVRLSFEQVDNIMTAVPTPTLLILGEQGFERMKGLLPKARKWFDNLEEYVLPGDHHLHMENSEGVAKSIAKFVNIS